MLPTLWMSINMIITFLSKRLPALKGIYLFGSHAENRARSDSDIDIAFLDFTESALKFV